MTESDAERVAAAHRAEVAASVRAEVARRRRTQKELAEVMHVSQQTVARRLSGELEFTVGELTRVAEFLDVPVERLLGIEARAS